MTTQELTDRQHGVLVLVGAYTRAHGYPPTIREIMRTLGLCSTSSVHKHLKALEEKGYIERCHRGARAITVMRHA